jgi:hypothetical protein
MKSATMFILRYMRTFYKFSDLSGSYVKSHGLCGYQDKVLQMSSEYPPCNSVGLTL